MATFALPEDWVVSGDFVPDIKNGRNVYFVKKIKKAIEHAIMNGDNHVSFHNRNNLPEIKEIVYSLVSRGFQIGTKSHGETGWRYVSYEITWKTAEEVEKQRIEREKRRAEVLSRKGF